MVTSVPDPPGGNGREALEIEREILAAYSDTAKSFTQLGVGALVLSITFFEKIANTGGKVPVDFPLAVAWSGWLVCALAGAFYQYLAVRFVETRGIEWRVITPRHHPQVFHWLGHHPWPVYGVMMLSFSIGCLAFLMVGLRHLPYS